MEKSGIKELKEVVDLGMAVEQAVVAFVKDGFQPSDLATIGPVVLAVQPAIKDIKLVGAELKDLSAEEAAELAAHVVSKGALPEKAALIVEKSVKVAAAAVELVKACVE